LAAQAKPKIVLKVDSVDKARIMVETLLPARFGVEQQAGVKLKNKGLIYCEAEPFVYDATIDGKPAKVTSTILVCDDGVRLEVKGVEFPTQ
jgi:hypothetical protein